MEKQTDSDREQQGERGASPSFSPAGGSANLNQEQQDILHHTVHIAAGGLYCGGGPDMDALVAVGLMEYAGRKSFVPDPYYRITGRGRDALRNSPKRTELTYSEELTGTFKTQRSNRKKYEYTTDE